MSYGGTMAHRRAQDIPASVLSAVALAEDMGFDESCLPEQGRLLALLAAGVGTGSIGETGTGCGVGLAWMAQAAHPSARLTSIDRDEQRVKAVREIFAERDTGPQVEIVHGEWQALAAHAPFELLVLDGGGHGKTGGDPVRLEDWVRPGGVVVIDDFTPFESWPPKQDENPDSARLHWLQHDRLLATEIVLTSAVATMVGRYLGPDRRRDQTT
jgi:predicted O-methyltransferase YrrM